MTAGRKPKYDEWLTPDGLLFIEGWARKGLDDKQIAKDCIGINPSTFCEWKNKFPQLTEALKKGRRPISFEVENQFIKSALGYKITLKKPIKLKEEKTLNGKGKIVTERIEYAEEEVYIKPESTNQIFYLKNHMPDLYKDRRENVVVTQIEQTSIDEVESFINGNFRKETKTSEQSDT